MRATNTEAKHRKTNINCSASSSEWHDFLLKNLMSTIQHSVFANIFQVNVSLRGSNSIDRSLFRFVCFSTVSIVRFVGIGRVFWENRQSKINNNNTMMGSKLTSWSYSHTLLLNTRSITRYTRYRFHSNKHSTLCLWSTLFPFSPCVLFVLAFVHMCNIDSSMPSLLFFFV